MESENFEQYLANSTSQVDIVSFCINILITFLLSLTLGFIYRRYGKSLSNRNSFSNNFQILSMTTMLIISIVKSSLALSLGLVGALSIVRFRTALKEPEELTFAFLCIAIGLGLGANQRITTILGFIIISFLYIARQKFSKSIKSQTINLVVTSNNNNSYEPENIINTISKFSNQINLRRLTRNQNNMEIAFSLYISKYELLIDLNKELKLIYPDLSINYIESSSIFNN